MSLLAKYHPGCGPSRVKLIKLRKTFQRETQPPYFSPFPKSEKEKALATLNRKKTSKYRIQTSTSIRFHREAKSSTKRMTFSSPYSKGEQACGSKTTIFRKLPIKSLPLAAKVVSPQTPLAGTLPNKLHLIKHLMCFKTKGEYWLG